MKAPPQSGDRRAEPLRIAVWSGPRSLSTVLMRSWGNRADTAVWDEPFYAHYLKETGVAHPGADEVVARHETDWRKVVESIVGPVPGSKAIYYQKHMTKHMLDPIDMAWLERVINCFLIREPREVITSFVKVVQRPDAAELGFRRQVEIFERVRRTTGGIPIVIDASDLLKDPRRLLGLWCERLGIPFLESMLRWPPGRRSTDGSWAKHWYAAVEASTTFAPYKPKNDTVPDELRGLLAESEELYAQLHAHRLR
jgi:hypothetical protein